MDPQNIPPIASTSQLNISMPDKPVRVRLEQPSSFWGRTGRRLFWAVLVISILMNLSLFGKYQSYFQTDEGIQEKYHSLSKEATDKIAIITVKGAIMEGDGFVKKQIDRVRDDKEVKAVVLRVDSPGGTVTGSDYIYHNLKKLLKDRSLPMVVSMGSVAASGGYYVSMAAGDKPQTIYAEPATWTGSIGVIIPHYDISGLLEKWSIADDSIASGVLKQMGSPTRKLPPKEREEEQAVLKGLVDDSFADFKQIVLDSRSALKNDPAKQEVVFTGRIFTAKQAKENGLVDELGFLEDAIDQAVKLAGLSKETVRVVKYKQPLGALSDLLGANEQARGSLNLSQLLDLTAPRAYYLCTWLPSIITTQGQ